MKKTKSNEYTSNREVINVFIDEVVRLSPKRKVEFYIGLVPKVIPLSMATYRMDPIQLKKTS